MLDLEELKGLDIYLLDQILKGNIKKSDQILDAGCGKGRNFKFFVAQGFNCTAIDPNQSDIINLKEKFRANEQIIHSSIESFEAKHKFGVIICNAVLHFANNHEHFLELFDKLVQLLEEGGLLFIRMTSDIGIESILKESNNGVYGLPDGTNRYLINRNKIKSLLETYQLKLIEPVKSVNVSDQRSMCTLVLQK